MKGEAHDLPDIKELSLSVRMELARIIDPRHDRDPEMVLMEVKQICDVFVRAVEKITVDHLKIVIDKQSHPGVPSPPAAAAPEDNKDAETAKTARRRKRSQIPLP